MAMHEPGAGNIAGIDYANKQVHDEANRIFDIKKGAEKHPDTKKGSVYWDFGSGALGQYYAGSLILLGLLKVQDRYFFATDTGKELGIAFDKSVDNKAKEFFFKVINQGVLPRKDVGSLSNFSLQTIRSGSDEWDYYIKLFFSPDRPGSGLESPEHTTFRKDTWMLFMAYLLKCENQEDWSYFPYYLYNNKGFIDTKQETNASIGWYYFSANELIHFAQEGVFSIILKTIEQRPIHINKLIPLLTKQCIRAFRNYYSISDELKTIDFIDQIETESTSTDYPSGILEHIKKSNTGEALAWAFELILNVYSETKTDWETFRRFAFETDTRDKRGNALEFYEEHIEKYLQKPFALFIERTINKIINDHLYVAYLKMGNGEGQVHKLLIEDNYLVHIATTEPRFTTPRLGTVRNFFIDLNLIRIKNNKYRLTEEGNRIYKMYKAS